ncbi:hypothetical protein SUGI_0496320 [Cryptomeria japonica]|nr:hypothetical protein SUGI_0496320 [Cryptomeria japonica]
MNFNPLTTESYDKPLWIQLNSLPMEYWIEEALEKIDRTLGTLMDIDVDLANEDFYLYARLKIATIRKIREEIRLRVLGVNWIQTIQIEEDKYYCLWCGRRNHSTNTWKDGETGKVESSSRLANALPKMGLKDGPINLGENVLVIDGTLHKERIKDITDDHSKKDWEA